MNQLSRSRTQRIIRTVMGIIDNSSHVVLASQDYWPLPWYYRGDLWDKFTFYGQKEDIATLTAEHPDTIILHDTESYDSIPGYGKQTYKLDYWFSFYDNENRLLRLLFPPGWDHGKYQSRCVHPAALTIFFVPRKYDLIR